jgi:hypothetical protein
MSTEDYAQKIRNALAMTSRYIAPPSVSFTANTGEGFIASVTPYLIWGLMVLFILALVIVIINYTIYPIFDFGSTPNALIHIPQSDWTYSWSDSDPATLFVDSSAAKTLPIKNFSLFFDTKVITTIPTADTNMKYVLVYKTTAGSGTAASAASAAAATATASTTTLATGALPQGSTCTAADVQAIAGAVTASRFSTPTGTAATIVQPIRTFTYLNDATLGVPLDPSLIAFYDAGASKIIVYLAVAATATGSTPNWLHVSTDIIPNVAYRVGIVVSDSIIELYLNGKWAASTTFGGKVPMGGEKDTLFSVPSRYSTHVVVRNLGTTQRVVSSGEMRGIGTPALQ